MTEKLEARLAAIEIALGVAVATMPKEQGQSFMAALDELTAKMMLGDGHPELVIDALRQLHTTTETFRKAAEQAKSRYQIDLPE